MRGMSECCPICLAPRTGDEETAVARSNVRRFAGQQYALWRCGQCQSIHAGDEADLDTIYDDYPFFRQKLDFGLTCAYRRLRRRIRSLGVGPQESGLDFGCGSGHLATYLTQSGYDIIGYDPYSATHSDASRLDGAPFDWLVAQDVLEHGPDPRATMQQLDSYVKPGGLLVLGTPNAEGIDLAQCEKYVHPLHQPFHRHIFSLSALTQAAEDIGWSVERIWMTPYTNMPVLSLPMLHHYMRCFDGTIDCLFDLPARSWKLWCNPVGLWYLLAGYWLCDQADVLVAFRKK